MLCGIGKCKNSTDVCKLVRGYRTKDRNGTLDRGLNTQHGCKPVSLFTKSVEVDVSPPFLYSIKFLFYRKNQRYQEIVLSCFLFFK
jgi:hypothetical protein